MRLLGIKVNSELILSKGPHVRDSECSTGRPTGALFSSGRSRDFRAKRQNALLMAACLGAYRTVCAGFIWVFRWCSGQ